MFKPLSNKGQSVTDLLASRAYWPARAAQYLAEGRYSRAVEVCKENLRDNPNLVSARLILARALYHAGQHESATEQFYRVMTLDPDNLIALKYLGDIKFAAGDELGAMAMYQRIQQLDPHGNGLCSKIRKDRQEKTKTITLPRPPEQTAERKPLRQVYFYTETLGDLYLKQGYPRLAAEVFEHLCRTTENPRLREKLQQSQQKVREKER
ncbi:tetratricopeptide repeat protein [candidate division GN15 bacterium]|nr:tetratricopeptide repeat protein [candidate division GN15 bacterium]